MNFLSFIYLISFIWWIFALYYQSLNFPQFSLTIKFTQFLGPFLLNFWSFIPRNFFVWWIFCLSFIEIFLAVFFISRNYFILPKFSNHFPKLFIDLIFFTHFLNLSSLTNLFLLIPLSFFYSDEFPRSLLELFLLTTTFLVSKTTQIFFYFYVH